MIWAKTDAGRQEIQARALVKERGQRNLLLLIDGIKSEEMLLASVTGLSLNDFKFLESLDLITQTAANAGRAGLADKPPAAAPKGDDAPLDYGTFTERLTQLISGELGLRGFTLTLAVEKASTIDELRDVAERALKQIRERKGAPAADKARRALYGD